MNVGIYTDYFRQLAVNHPLIGHVQAAESPNYPETGKRRFTTFNMQQVASGLRSAIADSPFLHLHIYDVRPKDNGNAITGQYTGGFLVTQKADNDSVIGIANAYTITEDIVVDIIGQMRLDFTNDPQKNTFPFGEIYWSQATINAAGPLWNDRYGWWVEFPFDARLTNRMSKATLDENFNRN